MLRSQLGHLMCQIIDIFFLLSLRPTLFFAIRISFSGSFYFVVSVWISLMQCVADLTAMIGMCCRTACCKAQEVTSYNTVYIASADSSRCLWCNTARSPSYRYGSRFPAHRIYSAGSGFLHETAMRQRQPLHLFPGAHSWPVRILLRLLI